MIFFLCILYFLKLPFSFDIMTLLCNREVVDFMWINFKLIFASWLMILETFPWQIYFKKRMYIQAIVITIITKLYVVI